MTHDFRDLDDIAAGAVVTSALLVAEHVALWPWRGRVPQLTLYALGVGAIGAGVSRVLWARGRRYETAGFWIITSAAGLTTDILHGWRAMQHHQERGYKTWHSEALELPPPRTPRPTRS